MYAESRVKYGSLALVWLVSGLLIWKYGTGVKLHTAHEHWMVCPTHILWRHNREICDERQCMRCILQQRRPPQLWRATNLIAREARHVDRFLMLSQSSIDNHRHFGGGQTEVELTLPAGEHTLQLLLADHAHIPHDPPLKSKQIKITVK